MKTKARNDKYLQSQFALSALIYKQKSCEVCRKKHNEASMVLCDRCQDAYHIRCINLYAVPQGIWMCSQCQLDVRRLKNTLIMNKRPVQKNIANECAGCKSKLGQFFNYQQDEVQFEAKLINWVTCTSCKQKYHSLCFSQRFNGINCSTCQQQIRQAIPKGHQNYKKFVQSSRAKIAQLNYLELIQGFDGQGNYHEYTCLPQMHLIAPPKPKDWKIIVCYQASLCYALMTRGMIFCQNLVVQMKTDRIQTVIRAHKESIQKIQRLHRSDQIVYQEFKRNHEKGYLPPLEIKQDRKKGFYLVATDFIPVNMILAEYTGELITARESLSMITNDSIFTMIRNPRSSDSLDIAPGRFAHMAIFISGINNSEENAANLQNVKALKFNYKGISRLIFCAMRDIKKQQTLYLNYNGDKAMCEYPTNNFVH